MEEINSILMSISEFILFVGIFIALFSTAIFFVIRTARAVIKLFLNKHSTNPMISPTPGSGWDEIGTFNPAAYVDDRGDVHLIYRAIGGDGVSRFGYATSADGITVGDKSPYPVFAMENPRKLSIAPIRKFDPVMYPSGGSWGGAEDPRMVKMGDKIYVTFSAFDGWDFIRIAVISIKEKDFLERKWKWSRPILISPEGEINKNWVLFPEKINGKFAILHNINPEIQIDYVDKLEELSTGSKKIKSRFGFGKYPRVSWDTWVRGVGPSPIKTDKGWLVLYHATSGGEGRYKIGAMLLDINNPEKVIARSAEPIMSPDEWYENDWKPGVVYACGAVIKDGKLLVYYGGGDKHVCVAEKNLDELLHWLLETGRVN